MERIAGIDGCRAGWFAVHGPASLETPKWFVAETFDELGEHLDQCDVIAIDMPIGIPNSGSRQCERLARKRLAPRRSASVFSVPIRPILGIRDYREACDRREAIDGKRMSTQAFNIMSKIKQVDDGLKAHPSLIGRVYEVHPELAFTALAGAPMAEPKKTIEGFQERRLQLSKRYSKETLEGALTAYPRKDVSRDDVLDAFAVMVSAQRILHGLAERLPAVPERDARGLDMAIWF